MDGAYSFVYCGDVGVGLGVFRILGDKFLGSDIGRAAYAGNISLDQTTGNIELAVQITVPAGGFLVLGTSPQEIPHTRSAKLKLPTDFANGKPFEANFGPGAVTIMVRRIPDEYSFLADGMRLRIEATEKS